MDATAINAKINAGRAKVAQRLGQSCALYRPLTAAAPLGNQIGTVLAAFNAGDGTYGKPNLYGDSTWFADLDGTQTQPGDILVRTLDGQVFFVAAQQPLLPIVVVGCERTVTVRRQQQRSGVGVQGYGGSTAANEAVLLSGWPASILQGTKGERAASGLPGDVRSPWWSILMPLVPGVQLQTGDIMTCDLGRRYAISSAEITDLGWRITAAQSMA